jgi:hypothetical protein
VHVLHRSMCVAPDQHWPVCAVLEQHVWPRTDHTLAAVCWRLRASCSGWGDAFPLSSMRVYGVPFAGTCMCRTRSCGSSCKIMDMCCCSVLVIWCGTVGRGPTPSAPPPPPNSAMPTPCQRCAALARLKRTDTQLGSSMCDHGQNTLFVAACSCVRKLQQDA